MSLSSSEATHIFRPERRKKISIQNIRLRNPFLLKVLRSINNKPDTPALELFDELTAEKRFGPTETHSLV